MVRRVVVYWRWWRRVLMILEVRGVRRDVVGVLPVLALAA